MPMLLFMIMLIIMRKFNTKNYKMFSNEHDVCLV